MQESLKNLLTQEVSQSSFHPFIFLKKGVQNKLQAKKCTKCKGALGSRDIGYILASNGRVTWWHYYECG